MLLTLEFPTDETNAAGMAAYMKHQFTFCGLSAPVRKELSQPVLKASKTWSLNELMGQIYFYYMTEQREYQYLAIDLAMINVQRFSYQNMLSFLKLCQQKAWWDSIDAWRKVIGLWWQAHPENQAALFDVLLASEDFWLRRIAITLQLNFKTKIQTAYLERAILPDLTTEEFFIQKAIGWALRDYAKKAPEFVQNFVQQQSLSPLALREATKHLSKEV